jgi:ferric-dicitrate binding protein FerR (iron transport regulator)
MNTPQTDEERETAELLGQLKVAPSAAARERAFAKLQQEFQAQHASAPARGHARWANRWTMAAGIAMALTAAWLLRDVKRDVLVARAESIGGSVEIRAANSGAQSLAEGGEISSGSTLSTGDAGGVLLRVSPDLTVRLAASTQARFAAGDELELRQGQVFIDATPGARTPLRVVTPYGTITHLGTQYLVKLGTDGVEVAVREGRAQIASASVTSVAEAGRWVLHRDAGAAPLSGALEPADPRFDWIGKLPSEFRLEGATLAGFLAWFQRETGLTPIYSPGLDAGQFAQVQLKGSIEDLEPLEALSYVLATADLAWHREGAKVVIEKRQAGTG